nr:MAG TPA: hypothetical protein [Caudoviricetes sp.]
MYKKTITYTDFNGTERTEDFYFHMTQAEILKMEYSQEGGMTNVIQKIIETEETTKLLPLFETVVRMSYGKRSVDGRHFEKKPEYTDQFLASEAYSNMFVEFMMNADEAAKFINNVCKKIDVDENRKSLSSMVSENSNVIETKFNN